MLSSRAGFVKGRFLALTIIAGTLCASLALGRAPSMSILVLIVGVAGLALLVQRPSLGLVVLASLSFTLPFQLGTGSEVMLTAPVLIVPVIALAWLLAGLRAGRVKLLASRVATPLVLFLVSGGVSLIAGNAYWDPSVPRPDNLVLVQLAQWAIFALSGVAFVIAGTLANDARALQIATFLFLGLGGIVAMHWMIPFLWQHLQWQNYANSAMFWTWVGGLAAGQVLFNAKLRRAAKVALVAVLLSAMYVVWFQERTWTSGWAPFTLTVVVVLLLRLSRRSVALAAVVVIVLLVTSLVLYPVLFEHTGGEAELQSSWGGRTLLYRAVLELANTRPILGLGPASYRHYAFTRWLSLGVGRALWVRPAVSSHNNYIDIYAQLGIVGLALFTWFLAELGKTAWQMRRRFRSDFPDGYVNGTIGAFAGTLLAMMLIDGFLPFVYNVGFPGLRTTVVAWMFLGALQALDGPPAPPVE